MDNEIHGGETHPWDVEAIEADAIEEVPAALEVEEEDVVLATPSSLKPDVQWYEDRS